MRCGIVGRKLARFECTKLRDETRKAEGEGFVRRRVNRRIRILSVHSQALYHRGACSAASG